MEHYAELEVAPTATPAEIRRSYLALARRFHPDNQIDATPAARARATERMAQLNAAWAVLSDVDRRARYDELRRTGGPNTSATVRDLTDTWQAFDEVDDDIDPAMLDDTPIGAKSLHWAVTMLPASLATAGMGMLALGFLIGLTELLAIGFMVFVLGGVSFLMIPLLALANSSRADRRG